MELRTLTTNHRRKNFKKRRMSVAQKFQKANGGKPKLYAASGTLGRRKKERSGRIATVLNLSTTKRIGK